jgi:hypothetical protein
MVKAQPNGVPWDATSPEVLVVACSDGRFQKELDLFLQQHFQISQYDRLYIPGGAGALVPSGIEFARAAAMQKECRFLIEAHGIKHVILLFHGPAADGPEEAACGDYRRGFPGYSIDQIRSQQDTDLDELVRIEIWRRVDLDVLRAEVTRGGNVEFVTLYEGRASK